VIRALSALCLALAALPAAAQYDRLPGARELCLAQARLTLARGDDTIAELVLDEDAEAPARVPGGRVGAQPASAVASGTGGLRRKDGSTSGFRWLCVLDDRWRPVFFHAATDPAPRALAECWRWSATRVAVGDCLSGELVDAERALEAAERRAAANAASLDAATGRARAAAAQRASDRASRAHREAECDRIAELASGGTGAGDFYRACLVDRTRARIAELAE
jgi:uncharacterized protein YecT (DUF1311 family)